MSDTQRPRPQPTPETRHFWDGAREGSLRLQRCAGSGACAGRAYFPPRPFCPRCGGRAVEVFAASGRARLHSYVIHHRSAPGFTPPYAIAVVELEEGPRMMTNILDCPQTPEALVLDMPLEVAFTPLDAEITLPLFRPVPAAEPRNQSAMAEPRNRSATAEPRNVSATAARDTGTEGA